MLNELRPYRRRLVILVVLAALAGALLGELAPGPARTHTPTAHHDFSSGGGYP
jgi:hypothetical protein